jgi:hypothetical protein
LSVRSLTPFFIAVALACTAPADRQEAPVRSEQRLQTIDHVAPRRDSTGATPSRFEWTRVEGADRYVIALYDDVDVLMWRHNDVREPSVEWPAALRVEPGTYFWMVMAFRDDRPIAESGRSAFVVLPASPAPSERERVEGSGRPRVERP